MSAAEGGLARGDLVSLADRLGALQLVRLGLAGTVLVAAADPQHIGFTVRAVAPITAVYLVATVAAEAFRRLLVVRGIALAMAMLLLDGLYREVRFRLDGAPRASLDLLAVEAGRWHLTGARVRRRWHHGRRW